MARRVKQEYVDLDTISDEVMTDLETTDYNASQSTGTFYFEPLALNTLVNHLFRPLFYILLRLSLKGVNLYIL